MAHTPEDSRTAVLAAALDLFGERGYGGTSLQAIAARLGFTKAAVYYHYRAKAGILTALSDPLLRQMDAVVAQAPRTWTRSECRDLLGAYLDAVVGARVLAGVLISDPTAAGHPAAVQLRAQRHWVRDLLVSPGSEPRTATVHASCALGAIEGAVLDFSDNQPETHRTIILAAAVGALAATPVKRAPAAKSR